MTLHLTLRESTSAEPAAGWRMTMTSMPIASMLRAVSMSVSPLLTLEPVSEKSIDVGAKPLSGQRKLVRVRVLSLRRTR